MKKKSKRNSWMVTLPLIAIAGGYLYFLFLPTKSAIAELREELQAKRTFIEQSSNLRVSIDDSSSELQNVAAFTQAWRDDAPTQATLSALLGDINQRAKLAGVEIRNFHPQQDTLNETFSRVPVSIEFTGTTSTAFAFLKEIEQLAPVIWIDSLNIEATGEHRQTVRGELTLVIFTANSEKTD
jgi:type IV pilus assembly protein PilO